MADNKNILGSNLVDLAGLTAFWGKVKEYISNVLPEVPVIGVDEAGNNHGIGITLTNDKKVKLNLTEGTVASGDAKYITGGTAFTAMAAAMSTAETNANNHTNTEIGKLDTKAQGYATTAKTEAIADAKTYTDGRETEIDKKWAAADATLKTDLEAYADQAETDAAAAAKGYTDEREVAITTAYKAYADDAAAAAAKTYSIVAVTGTELTGLGANVKEAYKLVDEDSDQSGEYIKIYKDSALQKVQLVDQELQFTYLLADGTTSMVPVSVATFLAESEFGNGLQVNSESGVVSVKVDATSETFLTVGANGIKLSGVQTAINTAKGDAIADANDYTDGEIGKLSKVAKSGAYSDLEGIPTYELDVATVAECEAIVK